METIVSLFEILVLNLFQHASLFQIFATTLPGLAVIYEWINARIDIIGGEHAIIFKFSQFFNDWQKVFRNWFGLILEKYRSPFRSFDLHFGYVEAYCCRTWYAFDSHWRELPREGAVFIIDLPKSMNAIEALGNQCAYVREDNICLLPPRSWTKLFRTLKEVE